MLRDPRREGVRPYTTMDKHNELYRAVGRIESKVDLLLERQEGQQRDINSLKIWRAWITGIAAGISALVSFLFR